MSKVQPLASRLQMVYGTPPPPPEASEPSPSFDEGFEAGFDAGHAEALAALEAEREALRTVLQASLEELANSCRTRQEEWLASMEQPLAGLAAVIAAKIIGQEISTSPEVMESWVRQALAEVTSETYAKVRVSPLLDESATQGDSDAAESRKGAKEQRRKETPPITASGHPASSGAHFEIINDPSITVGCVIETEHGMIDARIDSMLAEALAAIREAA